MSAEGMLNSIMHVKNINSVLLPLQQEDNMLSQQDNAH